MRSSTPDRSLIREYLLGRLDDKEEIEKDLSEKILLDDELCDTVDTVEDEIIEEYLDGTLSPADRSAVNAYFLRPHERQEKLESAKLLRHYFESGRGSLSQTKQNVPSPDALYRPDVRTTTHWFSRVSVYALTVLVLLGFVNAFFMRKHEKQLESQLAQMQQHIAGLTQEAQLSPSVLTLISPLQRGGEPTDKLPEVAINSQTDRIRVEIALRPGQSDACDVRLETRGVRGPIWSARLIPNVSPSGDVKLIFDVPTQAIKSGRYSFVVSTGVSSDIEYAFIARVTK